MDRFASKHFEKQTIYEIFRACRLCGAGGGFKMPIIQNVVDLDDTDVELKQKIRDCVQIEVHPDDKMPPLICELCIDKINDFYEFLEMCRQTNTRTRQRLGLPQQKALGVPDEGDCILGVTEALNVQDSEDEPLSKQPPKKTQKSTNGKKVPPLIVKKCNVKTEAAPQKETTKSTITLSTKQLKEIKGKVKRERTPPKIRKREQTPPKIRKREQTPPKMRKREQTPPKMRKREQTPPKMRKRERTPPKIRKREPTPPPKRITRKQEESSKDKDTSVKSDRSSRRSSLELKLAPKSILKTIKKEMPIPKIEDPHELLVPRRKRPLELTSKGPPAKKVKITPPPPPPPPPKPRPPSPKVIRCKICECEFKSAQGHANHMRTHVPTFTNPKLACNACGEWFVTPEEISSHHKNHSTVPYRCRNCFSSFDTYSEFNEHFEKDPCVLFEEIPDQKCDECWHEFVTQYLYLQHQCQGVDGRKGGQCKKCSKSYALYKNLLKHEEQCTYRKKGTVYIEPEIERRLRIAEVRVAKCDPLLKKNAFGRYNVALVPSTYGLDPNRIYPYRRIKHELHNSMVNIHYDSFDYIHWDSDYTANDSDESENRAKNRKIDSLSTLALKVIFSKRCLGRIPKKRRKAFKKDAFDVIMNKDDSKKIKKDIASIIADLDKAWEEDDNDEFGKENDTGSVSLLDIGYGERSDAESMKVSKDANIEDDPNKVSSNDKKVTDNEVSNNNGEAMNVSECDQAKLNDSLKNKNFDDIIGKVTTDVTENEVKDDVAESQTYTQDCTQDETSNSRLSPTFTQKVVDDVAIPNNRESENNDDKKENGDVSKRTAEDVENGESDKKNETSDDKVSDDKVSDDKISDDNIKTSDAQSNGVIKDNTENKKLNESEAYDKKLMAAIDEQIVANHNDTKKVSEIEEKMDTNKKPNHDKSMELDNISDGEINFDP